MIESIVISIFTELSNFINHAKTGLGFTKHTVHELVEGKSPMADESFANEVYNMPYAKGHRAVNDLELPTLTGRT